MSLATGTFTPWQSKQGGNTGGTYQRMAGDYMDTFTKQNPEAKQIIEQPSNVMKTLGGNKYSAGSSDTQSTNSAPTPAPTPAAQPDNKSVKPTPAQTSGPTMAGPKSGKYYADKAEVKAAWNATYDENQYKYYQGKDGVSTGADAYHTDMANYQAQMKTMGDNPHLGLVNQMMHPDWKDQNYSNGKYGEINKGADYSQKPDDWNNLNARTRALQKQMESSR